MKVRFQWTNDNPSTARWEQALSYDDAATWHVNWTMELTRIDQRTGSGRTAGPWPAIVSALCGEPQ